MTQPTIEDWDKHVQASHRVCNIKKGGFKG